MKATVVDLRRKMSKIIKALERNEEVTILRRGKKKGVIYPAAGEKQKDFVVSEHSAFGMWKLKKKTVDKEINELRKGRY